MLNNNNNYMNIFYSTGVENVNDSMYCDGKTLFNNSTCIELSPSDSPPSSEFLVTVITVPILGVLLLLVVGMVLVVCLCICSVRASKKRQHSMYNGELLSVIRAPYACWFVVPCGG